MLRVLRKLFDVGVVGHSDAYFNVAVKGSCVVDEDADFDGCGVGPFDAGHVVNCYGPSCGLLGLGERGCVA